jgi:hypothetical protein
VRFSAIATPDLRFSRPFVALPARGASRPVPFRNMRQINDLMAMLAANHGL